MIALATLASGGATSAHGASFTVDATYDAVDAAPGDGLCAAATAACTLRAAVMETNALPGADEISLPAGTYALSIPGAGEDAAATGDLDIAGDLTVTGAGAANTVIDAGGLDRAFHVLLAGSSTMTSVSVQNGSALSGGGIQNEGILNLASSIVRANEAETSPGCPGICPAAEGGGIANLGDLEVQEVTISDNVASVGGGIVNDGFASLTRSLVTNNTATSEGGAISNFDEMSISESTLSGNLAGSTGGAIDNNRGVLDITESTLDHNQSDYGGAVYNQDSSALSNVTVSANSAVISGGGLLNIGSSHTLTATNVTVADNTSPLGGDIHNGSVDGLGEPGLVSLSNTLIVRSVIGGDCSGPITSLGHNLDSDGSCGLSAVGDGTTLEPGIAPLADNGGPTQTHSLIQGGCAGDACIFPSPAIDAGDNAACPATDQRGEPRPFDGDGDGIGECDIGAYEQQEGPFDLCTGQCPPGPPSPTPTAPTPTDPTPTPALPIALPPTGGDNSSSNPAALAAAALALPALTLSFAIGHRFARRVFTQR